MFTIVSSFINTFLILLSWYHSIIDIESLQNKLLKVCYVPATSSSLPRVSFFFSFLCLKLRPLTVLMKQTRQAVHAIKQSILLDVYGFTHSSPKLTTWSQKSRTLPVLIRHLWQLKMIVFFHWCLICAVVLLLKQYLLEFRFRFQLGWFSIINNFTI